MTRIRKNITLHPRIAQMAEEIMPVEGFGDLTAFLEQLIRERYSKLHSTEGSTLHESPPAYKAPPRTTRAKRQ